MLNETFFISLVCQFSSYNFWSRPHAYRVGATLEAEAFSQEQEVSGPFKMINRSSRTLTLIDADYLLMQIIF
jgi:hypothetical protein